MGNWDGDWLPEDGPVDPELKGDPDSHSALPGDLDYMARLYLGSTRSKHRTHISEVSLHCPPFLIYPTSSDIINNK